MSCPATVFAALLPINTVQNISTSASPQLCQRQDAAALPVAADVADDAAESVLRQTAQQDIAGALYMIRSAVAGRVIQDDGQIRRRRAVQALFDGLPRCQTVAEADDRESWVSGAPSTAPPLHAAVNPGTT